MLFAFSVAPSVSEESGSVSAAVADAIAAPALRMYANTRERGSSCHSSTCLGAFTLPNLPVGPYPLEASLQGFQGAAKLGDNEPRGVGCGLLISDKRCIERQTLNPNQNRRACQ